MIASKRALIVRELEDGTGAAICAAIDRQGLRAGLRIWFCDLDEKHGPVAELRPYGLKGHRVELTFGNFSGQVLSQIRRASVEDVQLARALVSSIRPSIDIEVDSQQLSDWTVMDGNFRMTATIRDQTRPHDDASIIATCRDAIVPVMAAMAELIGYDIIEPELNAEEPAYEGAVLQSIVKRRERNPRNRLLCVRLHGEKCAACGMEPRALYGEAGAIIEVHHLEPLAHLAAPKPYDPRTDLVPLCPSCHRAVHTRRPAPFAIEDLKVLMEKCRD
ncbi:HNH endonuclease [Cupriavidus sp. SK-4]|uniref:HNH endonuclease n=1 Tax=Cupriavidus sp. SK-4 TaxID=574750 RepID=UPI0009FBE620|nr:HNH endonuclease [Cupriavidus sp. SK-4]